MLSTEELNHIHNQLNHLSNSLTTKQKRSIRHNLKKQLQEHNYASKYPPYQPTSYGIIFINRTTTTDVLIRLDQEIKEAEKFMLDTESVMVKFKPNVPALIQIQIYSPTSSTIMIIEVHHLPNQQQQEFRLIKNLFQSLLTRKNQIFSWGGINELNEFLQFNLFNQDQIYLPTNRNIQDEYKTYWDRTFPHQTTVNAENCRCRHCFGVGHKQLLGIQDVTAFELNEWLNKQLTCQKFNIGLDQKLQKYNLYGSQYRQSLVRYAANDCDAILRIIIKSNIINNQYSNIEPSNETEDDMLIDDLYIMNDSTNNLPTAIENHEDIRESTSEIPVTSANNLEPSIELILNNEPTEQLMKLHQSKTLSEQERKKIHNRSRTLHQRKKAYTYELFIRNIEKRFPIRLMKTILKENGVEITQVNPLTSNRTNETMLRVGIKNPKRLEQYKKTTHGWFTKQHYQRLFRTKSRNYRHDNGQTRSSSYNHQKRNRTFR